MNTKINRDFKIKIVFALIMGVITTGIISFSLIAINVGFTKLFFQIWLKSWFLAYIIVMPAIVFVAPPIERFINRLF